MITPAIIPESFEKLKATAEKLSFAPTLQIDVVDGVFAPFKSWPYEQSGAIADAAPVLESRKVEIDLMVKDGVAAGEAWLRAGARGLVFHLEALESPKDALSLADEFIFDLGLAISNDTPLEKLYPYMDSLDFVQLMGISDIGRQGQPFDERVIERIVTLWTLYPNIPISIDGGVSEKTIKNMKTAGASRFVVGSAILKAESPEREYQKLLKIITE